MDDNQLLDAIRETIQNELKREIEPLKREIEGISIVQRSLSDDITEIKVTQENVTNKNIQLLMEGQKGVNEQFQRLDDLEEKVDDIQVTVSVLKLLAGHK